MRKGRGIGPAGRRVRRFLMGCFYAFRSPLWRELDNLSCLPADRAGKALQMSSKAIFQWENAGLSNLY